MPKSYAMLKECRIHNLLDSLGAEENDFHPTNAGSINRSHESYLYLAGVLVLILHERSKTKGKWIRDCNPWSSEGDDSSKNVQLTLLLFALKYCLNSIYCPETISHCIYNLSRPLYNIYHLTIQLRKTLKSLL